MRSFDISTPAGLRDRALIGLLVYTFARVGAAVKLRVEDVYTQGRRTWVRLLEKGGKRHEMPCHHLLDEYLATYLTLRGSDRKAWLFTSLESKSGGLTERPLSPVDV